MESTESSTQAKLFNPPPEGQAGIYVYRDSSFGGALKKDIWIDGKCVGESAPYTFFYEVVAGDQEHTISTESEFSPNDLVLETQAGKNYYVEQYIKMGVFVGGANLKQVEETKGQADIAKLDLAKGGSCSR